MPALGLQHVTMSWQHEKIEQRRKDPNVTPTSFLWSAYYPNRYYFEVCLPVWGRMDGDLIKPLSAEEHAATQVSQQCRARVQVFCIIRGTAHFGQAISYRRDLSTDELNARCFRNVVG